MDYNLVTYVTQLRNKYTYFNTVILFFRSKEDGICPESTFRMYVITVK